MFKEIASSCACSPVAEAAVRSLGPSFAHRVKSIAHANGVSMGSYASRSVTRFIAEASPATKQALREAMRASEQPILAGMAFILALAMNGGEDMTIAPHRSVMAVAEPESMAH